ncbi:bglI Probable beta-glucosidase I [Candida maltosa Xu316]|uniref:beta-glucosidase n=1 Tax=Candida maltosa (strain Xu316) TaxID=1245528 RepID=M3K3L3_CANMX|nr:Beta-glucosidase [Candida maltosa Xu316]
MSSTFDIDSVLSQLTLDEKIALVAGIDFWHTAPIPRLNIPSLRFSDGPNGVRGTRFFNSVPSACFPCGTALASTFDTELLNEAGQLMGQEAKFKSAHVLLGPTMNIQRGPLGGRGFESFSEDPYLTGKAATGIVTGIESQGVASTPKHFVCNDLEHERNSSDSTLTERALREIYLEPFRILLHDVDAKALMTSYNKVNGVHASQNEKLLKGVLRDEWNWDGTTMSDWFGTFNSYESLKNGLDIEMPGPSVFRTVGEVGHMVKTKELHVKHLDERVKSVLKLIKFAKDSGIPENGPESTDNNTPETRALLRKLAQDSIVLLKNDDDFLPLKKEATKSVAVIGPNAKIPAYCGGGSASLRAYYTTTPFDSISEKLSTPPKYTVGAYAHKYLPGLGQQVINPKTGKSGYSMKFYNEPSTASKRTLIDEYDEIDGSSFHLVDYYNDKVIDGLYYIDFLSEFTPTETAIYEFGLTVVGSAQLFVDGKLVVDNKTKQTKGDSFFNCGTIEERGQIELTKGKTYTITVEFGSAPTYTLGNSGAEYFGGGINLGLAKVIDPEQEILNAVELAKSVDTVILSIGLNQEWESESYDRPHMRLEGYQNKLIEAVLAANPNTVIVNQSGTPVEFPWLDKAKALIHCWFGGNEAGNGIADVLFGDAVPSGKLSLTFPVKNEDNPTFLNFRTERGRVLYGEDIFVGYRYYEKLGREVAFPFGYGLSYTKFAIDDLKVDIDEKEENVKVSVVVKNTGSVEGAEVVQVYTGKEETDVIRPVKELKGFEKVKLQPGESKKVELVLPVKYSVSFFDEYANEWSVQSGDYKVYVGNSSDNTPLTDTFTVQKEYFWTGI